MLVVEANVLKVANVGEDTAVVAGEGVKGRRLGAFGGCHAWGRARTLQHGADRVGGAHGHISGCKRRIIYDELVVRPGRREIDVSRSTGSMMRRRTGVRSVACEGGQRAGADSVRGVESSARQGQAARASDNRGGWARDVEKMRRVDGIKRVGSSRLAM